MRKASTLANQFAANMQGQINAGMVEPVKKSKFEFKDVARIVQGILVSKAFYSGLNAIRSATDAVWEFSKQLEYAQMVYSNLFGSSALASEFINVLKDFAAVTPFSFKQSEEAAKRLLAYGIEYQNIMYVMQGVLAAATVQGTDAVIEPISRAFGQIYTKGRLMNEEMRQLAEAGIPVYDILQEKLGLTAKELRNLGRTAVPASDAINALIEGINERFGTTLQYASMTITGIISNIKDNAVMLFSSIFQPFTEQIKMALGRFVEFIGELRSLQEVGGIGAVFERLVPPSLQQAFKSLIANVQVLWQVIKVNLNTVLSMLKSLLVGLLHAFNALAPAIFTVLSVIAGLGKAISSNEKLMKGLTVAILAASAAWLVYKLQAITAAATTALIKGIVTAVRSLVIALNFLVAHPVWAMLAVGVGLFVALSGASEKFRNSINSLYKNLYQMGSINTDNMLLPDSKERASDLSKFNKALGGTSSAMDDLADSTGSAVKAAKGLLGFDEVFSLKTPDEGAAADYASMLDGLTGMDFPDLSLETPDVTEIATNFVDSLVDALGGQDKILAAGIGSLLGAAIGAVIGGPIGSKIGGVIGGIAGWFWPEVAKALGLTDVGTVALPIAAGLGMAIGFVAGGPLGAVIGTAIGALVGWIIDSITRGIKDGDWTQAGKPIGIGLGAAIGMIAGGPLGALVGAAIGGLVGWIVDMFVNGFTNGDWDVTGISLGLGTGIGAAIGMIAGGPAGAAIGAAVGALVGWIVSLIVDNWDAIAKWFEGVGQWFVGIGQSIGQFFVGIGNGIATFFSNVGTWLANVWNTITTWFSDMLTAFGNFFVNLWNTITTAASNLFQPVIDAASNVWNTISPFLTDVWNGITTVFTDIFNALVTVGTDIWNAITTVTSRIWTTLTNIWELIRDLFLMYGGMLWDIVSEKFNAIWTTISTTMQRVLDTVVEKVTGVWNSVSTWFQKIWETISTKLQAVWNTVSEKFQAVWNVVSEKLSKLWTLVSDKFQAIWNVISEKLQSAWNTVKEKFQGMCDTVTEKLSSMWTTVKTNFQAIWDSISEKLSGAWDSVKEFFGGMYDSVKDSITDMYDSVKEGIGNIYSAFTGWISDMWDNVFNKFFGWIDDAISKLRKFFRLDSKAKSTDTSYTVSAVSGAAPSVKTGHAIGGIFNREHVARFAEGNKAEAIIPLENESAMQPFVDAVSNGITSALLPIMVTMTGGNQNQLQPLYVGTLIADDRGLKELERKMQVIRLSENQRRG